MVKAGGIFGKQFDLGNTIRSPFKADAHLEAEMQVYRTSQHCVNILNTDVSTLLYLTSQCPRSPFTCTVH